MLKQKKMSQFTSRITWHGSDERHFEAVKHVLKSTVAVKNTLAMKENVDIVKLDPVM